MEDSSEKWKMPTECSSRAPVTKLQNNIKPGATKATPNLDLGILYTSTIYPPLLPWLQSMTLSEEENGRGAVEMRGHSWGAQMICIARSER